MIKTKKQLFDESGGLHRKFKACQTDLSSSPEKGQAQRTSDSRYRVLAEHASEAILVTQNEKILYANKKAAEITGYSEKILASKSFIEVIHPDDRNLISFDGTYPSQNETTPQHMACRMIDSRQNTRWVDAKFLKTIWREKPTVLCFLTDITERRATEEALRFSEAKYRQLVEYSPAGIYEIDLTTGRLISVNAVMCEYTGFTKEEFLNLKMWELLKGKSRVKLLERYEKMMKCELVPEEAEYEIIGKNNRKISFLVYTRIEYKQGKPVRATTVAHDITELKKLEEELSKARKLESIAVLAGGIGHDFNNLLSGIIGNISLAKLEADRGETEMESLDEALRVSAKASALTQQLLLFSKSGAPTKKAASIEDVLRDSAAFTLRGSQVKCEFDIEENLWPVKVDIGQFSQVIYNLVINALQAMAKSGAIELRAKNITLEAVSDMPLKPGRYVEIKIQDQGNGIARENLLKIFDPYYTTKTRASGLGLTMSYTIIKRHDGHITAESELGKGSLFCVYLPATEEEPAETINSECHAEKNEDRILVIDQKEDLR